MSSTNTRNRFSIALLLCTTSVFTVLGFGGCMHGHNYVAATLPPELEAARIENAHVLNLSGLSGPQVSPEIIGRGDVLKVSIAAGLEADAIIEFPLRVGDDGTALISQLGRIYLDGLHLMQAEQQIAAACIQGRLYRQPNVTVTMQKQQLNQIIVTGGVEKPRMVELPRGSSYLLQAIIAAGGLGEDAGTRVEIRLPRDPSALAAPGPYPGEPGVQLTGGAMAAGPLEDNLICLNLAEAVRQPGNNTYLPDGSIVMIEKRQPESISILGLVKKPSTYDFPVKHDFTLLRAIAEAGGTSSDLADKVYVMRKNRNGEGHVTILASLSKAKKNSAENIRLQPGDIVTVEHTPTTVVSGIITRIIRFGVSASVPLF